LSILKNTLLSTIVLLSTTLVAKDSKTEYLGLFSKKEKSYMVGEGEDAIKIQRTMTKCAKNKGFFQPFSPVKGITPVTEADMLKALNDKNIIVVDMRKQKQYLEETIPTAISIPFGEIETRLDELGCEDKNGKWDCKDASVIYGFCNGPVCAQSPIAMKVMVRNGYPVEKIYYYRGGMLNWSALGLTTVPGEF